MPRNLQICLYICVAICLVASGCSKQESSVSTKEDVTKFQGDPKSPDLQNALKAGFGAAPKPGAPATPPASTGG